MKKLIIFTIITTLLLTLFACQKGDFVLLNAEDYGIVANNPEKSKSNTTALNKLIKKSRNYQKSEIIFGNETYYFNTSTPIKISDTQNLTVKGNNTNFINTSYSAATPNDYFASSLLVIENSENLIIDSITFDYQNPVNIQGKVIMSAPNITVIETDDALTGDEKIHAVNEIVGNKVTKDIYLSTPTTVILNDNKIQINNISNTFEIGATLVLRPTLNTQIPSFMINNTNNLTFKNITVKSSPSATVYSTHGSSNFYFENFNITPADNRLYSSNVDGIHLKNFSGEVKLNNCNFVGMGDDSLNVNSHAAKISEINSNKIKLNPENLPPEWAKEGDILKAYNENWELTATLTVTQLSNNTITVDGDTSKLTENCVFQNTRYLSKITIENTNVNFTRARAFMLRSKDVTVKNCEIKNTTLPAIIASADINYWYEMSPSENLVIENNVFENCCTNSTDGVISIKYSDDNQKTYDTPIHKNIIIRNNTFKNLISPAIFASGVDTLIIQNNIMPKLNENIITQNCINTQIND